MGVINTKELFLGKRSMSSSIAIRAIIEEFNPTTNETQCERIRALGNSHSLKLVPMLAQIGKTYDIEIISKEGPDYISLPSGDGKHLPKLGQILSELDKSDLLILSNRNYLLYQQPFINGAGDKWGDPEELRESPKWGLPLWLEELDQVIDATNKKGINVVLFLPLPEFSEPIPHRELYEEEWFRTPKKQTPSASPEFLNNRFPPGFFAEVKRRALNHKNFFVFDPMPFFLNDNGNYTLIVDGVVAYSDTHHLSTYGSMLLLKPFHSFLVKNDLL